MITKIFIFISIFLFSNVSLAEEISTPNPSVVGWSNLFMPGLGATIRGEPLRGLGQFTYEVGSLSLGYFLTDRAGFSSLDGVTDTFKPYRQTPATSNPQESLEAQEFSDILLEFSIKSHMMNTFFEYRDAYRARGITEGLDQRDAREGLTLPFKKDYIQEPDVWIPLAAILGGAIADYFTTAHEAIAPLNGASNALYDFNIGFWQPMGSGYPEEAFYRGFLQHEVTGATSSPLLGILAQSVLFAFSHEPGGGRYAAFGSGLYLGWLSYTHHGDLGPGTTLHFWGDFVLGMESILLSHRSQHTTPQAGLEVQFNY